MFISGKYPPQITTTPIPLPTSSIPYPTPTPSTEMIYVESDDSNPLHVHYDFENNVQKTIVKDDETENTNYNFKTQKSYLRNVRNSKRRHT
jgi:hypothetical protein